MSTVFVTGAGASYGDSISIRDSKHPGSPMKPPLICGFFRKDLLDSIHYKPEEVEADYPEAFQWIRLEVPDTSGKPVGEPPWDQINLEEIFTAVELRREFESPESDAGARLRIIRNQLVRYIARILALCTQNCYGQYSRLLISKISPDDSLFTFNWDLLLDEPFTIAKYSNAVHLQNFLRSRHRSTNEFAFGLEQGSGLYLKLHGSLNWFLCTNPKCNFASELQVDTDTQHCLLRAAGFRGVPSDIWAIDVGCSFCGSATAPLIVPPLVRKPIADDATIRSIWGLARNKLQFAERIVLIGFSAAPTDFFVTWLLHSSVLDKPGTDVIVVNPLNDPEAPGHKDFTDRMKKLFPYRLNTKFREFSELDKFV